MVGGLMVQSDQLASDAKRVAMPWKPNRLGKIDQRTIQNRLLDPLQKIRVVDLSNPTLGIFEARARSASPRGSQQAIGKGRPLIDTHATVPKRAQCLRDDPSFLLCKLLWETHRCAKGSGESKIAKSDRFVQKLRSGLARKGRLDTHACERLFFEYQGVLIDRLGFQQAIGQAA